jgi:nitrite reductase/ring-hydroxylating ferredoxin subunit/multimeric flavodoxin WrbA
LETIARGPQNRGIRASRKIEGKHITMAEAESWVDIGGVDEFSATPLKRVTAMERALAVSLKDGTFGVVSNVCNHVGGPLGDGRLDGDYIVCPWHNWKFHRVSGVGEPGFEADRVPSYPVKVEGGRVLVNIAAGSKRQKSPHEPHPLSRKLERAPGALRLAGISTTVMDAANPRFSGSDHLLDHALRAAQALGAETKLISLNKLNFRHCEGYYSKAAQACTWPCSITQMDAKDQMEQVYEVLVHWADAVVVASPIRWGAASSLYFKMAERLNCVQNAVTIRNQVLIRNKVAGFIIVGGQDNIQGVAGQMLGFFAELGFIFPQFPYIAHSRGWSHEDMECNVEIVRASEELAEGASMLAKRCLELAADLISRDEAPASIERGGRKAHTMRS